jgi:hypothetical protein
MLGMLCLYLAGSMVVADLHLMRAAEPGTAVLTRWDSPASDTLFLEVSSADSKEFGLQCAQESKAVPGQLDRVLDHFALARQHHGRLWATPALSLVPPLLFFPRKFSPPSADDGPFLS